MEPERPAGHRVLREAEREAREAPRLGAVAERQQHRQDDGHVGHDAADADRRDHRALDERPPLTAST